MSNIDGSAEETCKKLRAAYPCVHLRREDAAESPELCRLLLQLSRHVDRTGTSRSVAADLAQERQKLAQTVTGYQAARLTQTVLERLATQPASAADADDDALGGAVRECLSLAELLHALPLSASAGGDPADRSQTLLGLTRPQLAPSAPHAQTLARLPRALDLRLAALARRYTAAAGIDADGSGSVCGQLAQLPTQLQELLDSRRQLSEQLQQLMERRDQQLVRHSQLISQQLAMLLQLINRHRLEHRVDLERKTVDHLSTNVQGMLLKIRLLQLEIECATYTEQCLAALRAASRHVRSAAARQDQQLARARQQLATYQTAGAEFSALAHQYQQLCKEAEHKRWLIAEMDRLGAGGAPDVDGAAAAGS